MFSYQMGIKNIVPCNIQLGCRPMYPEFYAFLRKTMKVREIVLLVRLSYFHGFAQKRNAFLIHRTAPLKCTYNIIKVFRMELSNSIYIFTIVTPTIILYDSHVLNFFFNIGIKNILSIKDAYTFRVPSRDIVLTQCQTQNHESERDALILLSPSLP